ncbi:hypothetical protein AHAS_Ahas03G0328500 [Arachis hypogaea]
MERGTGRAGCGGLLRDGREKWIGEFSYFIGHCSAYKAKLWGVAKGLEIAWTMGIRKLVVECDSQVVILTFNEQKDLNRYPNTLIKNINIWRRKN